MKILAIICEFNPFHNGHKYLIEEAKKISGCDAVMCVMSGNFTQRGDICVNDKYTRARHAVLGGADCVVQLPAPFAVAPAEIFARGAIKIAASVPEVCAVAFGCENPETDFTSCARIMIDESEEFKRILGENLASGESYIKSYAAAFKACGGNGEIVSKPNNILGLEYAKAVLRCGADVKLYPVKRVGADFGDGELKENFSSASAIRRNITSRNVAGNVPAVVYKDLSNRADEYAFGEMLRNCLFKADAENLKRIYGCGEGLENALKGLENYKLDKIIESATSKRYSSSRIKRILVANMLELYDCDRFLNSDLYIKPLAVKKERADEILSALSKSRFPVITGVNGNELSKTARECFEKDRLENSVYNHINCSQNKDYMILV